MPVDGLPNRLFDPCSRDSHGQPVVDVLSQRSAKARTARAEQ